MKLSDKGVCGNNEYDRAYEQYCGKIVSCIWKHIA